VLYLVNPNTGKGELTRGPGQSGYEQSTSKGRTRSKAIRKARGLVETCEAEQARLFRRAVCSRVRAGRPGQGVRATWSSGLAGTSAGPCAGLSRHGRRERLFCGRWGRAWRRKAEFRTGSPLGHNATWAEERTARPAGRLGDRHRAAGARAPHDVHRREMAPMANMEFYSVARHRVKPVAVYRLLGGANAARTQEGRPARTGQGKQYLRREARGPLQQKRFDAHMELETPTV